jgi:hypothetical protein
MARRVAIRTVPPVRTIKPPQLSEADNMEERRIQIEDIIKRLERVHRETARLLKDSKATVAESHASRTRRNTR